MRRLALIGCLLSVCSAVVVAQYGPPAGGEDIYDLYSPILLAEAGPSLSGEGPQADAVNPAVSGAVQRTTIDASYLSLVDFGSGEGWRGHVVNLGFVAPTRVGVFSSSAHFVTSALSGMPWGTSLAIHASAAKELFPGWLAGTGARFVVGRGDQLDFGAALDLGVVREAGTVGSLQNVTWGMAFQNIGKWYEPVAGSSAMPSPFTPSAGFAFDAVQNDWLRVRTTGSLSAPAFRNLRAGVGVRATLFDAVGVHGGIKVDLRQLIDSGIDTRSFIPSFGVSVTVRARLGDEGFAADRGWTQTEVTTAAAAAPLYNGIWAIGGGINAPLGIIDTVGPDVRITYPEIRYISPNNDGVQDALVVPIQITDSRFVVGWAFEVYDASDRLVRTIRNKDERPENKGFQNIVDRITEVRTGVTIPAEIRWDGRSDAGTLVPDGEYRFLLRAIDDNGNVGSTGRYIVYVDTTPPHVTIQIPPAEDLVFSPNGDGFKDTLEIVQTGSREDRWDAVIVNALGRVVRTYTFQDARPSGLSWDGRGDDGAMQPDGVYRYRIGATDRAGNTGQAELANIILNTEETPVALAISSASFSPNDDGRLDTISITADVPNKVGILSWSLAVLTEEGRTVRTYENLSAVPGTVVFDGRDEQGRTVPEGVYFAEIEIVYRNGNRPSAQSPPFSVDLTPPSALARADVALFSPTGDGVLDTITIFQEAGREEQWVATIRNAAGTTVRTFSWSGVPPARVVWDGRQDDGRLAPDGRYTYVLSAEDRSGNIGASDPVTFEIDTSQGDVAIVAELDAFSPNADGIRDRQQFLIRAERRADIASFRVAIQTAAGEVVRTYEGQTAPAATLPWDGTLATGRRASDGSYRATLRVTYTNAAVAEARTALFVLDTVAPEITLATDYLLFSPDGDGNRDTVTIRQRSSEEELWVGAIRDQAGRTVREYRWSGRATDFEWDGTDAAGNRVPDGRYEYRVSATDRAGNSTERSLTGFVVDTRIPRLFVTASTTAFSPNNDGIRDDFSLDLYTSLLDGVESWRLRILTTAGVVVREFSGTDMVANRTIAWDGRDGRGQLREGVFTAEYEVHYTKGNRARVASLPFRVDVTPPQVRVSLSPVPFSPDNDGVDDELRIRITVTDDSPIQAWRFEILDRNRRFFNEFAGRGMPAPVIVWDGRAADGELVISAEDYPYRLTVSDELGNTTVTEGIIPVDILVIRDGDRLKVQIPSITFAPNSPELVLDPADERGAKNLAILERLADIFTKYGSYSIRIEGHAVNVTGTEREEREELQPLSLARAQSVRTALVGRGIGERRISVLGRGGLEPLVPHTDLDNRWKNRRVEFILIR